MTPQQLNALHLANHVRLGQGAFRRDMSAMTYAQGCLRAAALLVGDVAADEAVERMRVGGFLCSIHRFGPRLLEPALKSAGIGSGERRVRELTNRQRVALAAWIDPGVSNDEAVAA